MDIPTKNPFTFIDEAVNFVRIIPNTLYTVPANRFSICWSQTFNEVAPNAEESNSEFTLTAGETLGNDDYFYFVLEYKTT